MAAPKPTTWAIEPHTQAKHEILRRYLQAWFPILNKYYGRIIYLDGFAGPGEYEGGEPGSPIVALDVAANHRKKLAGELVFWFVDEREDRINHLNSLLNNYPTPGNFKVYPEHEEFHKTLEKVLDQLETQKANIAPTFAFIDPLGFSGVPMHLVHRLLKYRRTEIFITFMTRDVNRFLRHPDPQVTAHIIELFGTKEVLKIAANGGNRIERLRSLYQSQLQKQAGFVRYFHMKDKNNAPIYDLFFAGNNELGHYKMKEAMWKADPDGQFTFSDATNPNQLVLFTLDPASSFFNDIYDQFEGKVNLSMREVKKWVRNKTPYLETHMRGALKRAEEEELGGRILVNPVKEDGKPRRKGTFPDQVLVSFPKL